MNKDIYIIATDTCYGIWCAIDETASYEKIYKIKKRSYDKPLAILIESFDWLFENTYLTEEQIDFLKSYENPFTILCECPAIKALIHFDEGKHFYKNKDVYDKIAFRVAHTASQKKLLSKIGPMFLTSANYSGKPEIYTKAWLRDTFEEYDHLIHIVSENDLNPEIKPSDLFEFVWETTEIQYLRKNS